MHVAVGMTVAPLHRVIMIFTEIILSVKVIAAPSSKAAGSVLIVHCPDSNA
jgi:hypothetical protein